MDVGLEHDDGSGVGLVAAPPRRGASGSELAVPPPFVGTVPERRFLGKTALITGAASDMGRAFARALSSDGAHVFLLDDDLVELRRTAASLADSAHSLVLRCDLGSLDDVGGVGDFLQRTAAPISLVVHAATVDRGGTMTASTVEVLDEHYLVSVRGPYALCQQVLPQLSRGARIVFVDDLPSLHDPDSSHRAIIGAARMVMIDELRRELSGRWLSVISLRTEPSAYPDEVVAVAIGAMDKTGPLEVSELTVGGPPPARSR